MRCFCDSLKKKKKHLSKRAWIYLRAKFQTFTTAPRAFHFLFTAPAGGIDCCLTFPGCHQSPQMAVLITTSCWGLQSAARGAGGGAEGRGGDRVGLGGSG